MHRDVSPANVLCGTAGEIKLIDFGVAKALDRVTEETSAGVLKGKITYMAPEQAMGRRVDRRADVWACGVMLYQLLSGKLPYEGENQVATLHLLLRGAPPPPLRGVPEEVAEIAYTALSYSVDGRYASADEMHRAVEAALVRRCGAVPATDVAEYLTRELSERIDKRRKMIERALKAAEERNQMASEFEQAIPSDRSVSYVSSLQTPSALFTAETRLAAAEKPPEDQTAVSEYAPQRKAAPAVVPDVPTPSLLDLDVPDGMERRFGTRRRAPLVIAGFVAAIVLVGYAGYLVWDRISVGETPALSH